MLARIADRLQSAHVDEWWLATSRDPADDVTEAWGFELGLRVFRGHPSDVLSRFLAIGAESHGEWCVRVMADDPFLDAALVDSLLDARDGSEDAKRADAIRHAGGVLIAGQPTDAPDAETAPRTSPRLPIGYGVELVRMRALERAASEIPAKAPHHRTHVTSWLDTEGQGDIHAVETPAAWPDRPDWRWTVDTYEDLAMARSAFRVFGAEASTLDYPGMVARLDAHPEIATMNAHVAKRTRGGD
jgi:spore coat polysaccharide biosynthesis protein SpsF